MRLLDDGAASGNVFSGGGVGGGNRPLRAKMVSLADVLLGSNAGGGGGKARCETRDGDGGNGGGNGRGTDARRTVGWHAGAIATGISGRDGDFVSSVDPDSPK